MNARNDPTRASDGPSDVLRVLRRTRQYREFEPTPPTPDELEAILDVARWTGSSRNSQPWRFIVLTDPTVIRAIHDAGLQQTRGLATAPVAIAIVLPADPSYAIGHAYDEGRVAERMLIAASGLGLGAGVSWIRPDVLPVVADLLGLPPDRIVRTIVQIGHPTAAARAPKSAPGTARLPAEDLVYRERWPAG